MRTRLIILILLYNFAATAQSKPNISREALGSTKMVSMQEVSRFLQSASLENLYEEYLKNKKLGITGSRYYTGSPYLDEEFQTGDLIRIDSLIFNNLELRYNIYKDNIEFINKGTIQVAPSKDYTNTVIIGEKTFKFTDYLIKNKTNFGFLEQLVKGNCCLYYQHKVGFKKATAPKAYGDAEPAKFINLKGRFFIQLSDKAIISINGKKDLLELLSNNKKKVQKFLKTEKLSLKKKRDLIKLVQYYNELNKSSI